MKPVKALLVDRDGTLVDHGGAAARAAAAMAPPGSGESFTARWFAVERHAMDRYLAGEVTFAGQRRLRARAPSAEFGLGLADDAQIDAWFVRYLSLYEEAWRPFPDAAPTLRLLHGTLPLGVITNGDAIQQRAERHRTGLAGFLPLVVVSSAVGAAKPAPRIFHAACDA